MKKLALILAILSASITMAQSNIRCGKTSWYGKKLHGRRTASGERFDMNAMTTAATNVYNFGDTLKVTNIANGKSVIVRVNDRGEFKKYGILLDLSKGAFSKIAKPSVGVIKIKVEKLNK